LVKFSDLLNGLKTILFNNFTGHRIYSEAIAQDLKRPSFFIQLFPLSSKNFNEYYREQRALIDISYYSDEGPDLQSNFKNFEMANAMQSVLNTDIKVLDRNLNMQELEFETVDRVLHSTFSLSWYNENEVTQAYLNQFQVMQEFELSINEVTNMYYVTNESQVFKATDNGFYAKVADEEIETLRDSNLIKI